MQTTIAIVLDDEHLAELAVTLPTWVLHHPELLDLPWLVSCDTSGLAEQARELLAAHGILGAQFVTWTQAPHGIEAGSQRDRALWQYLAVIPDLVQTLYWVKIDTDVVGIPHRTGPGWLELHREASVTGSPWSYTKGRLDEVEDWLNSHRNPDDQVALPPFERRGRRDYCPRLIGWLSGHETVFTRELAMLCRTTRPPLVSHDTLTWAYGLDAWLPWHAMPYRDFGWQHVKSAAIAAGQLPTKPAPAPHRLAGVIFDVLRRQRPDLATGPCRMAELGVDHGGTSHGLLCLMPQLELLGVDFWGDASSYSTSYRQTGDQRALQSLDEARRRQQIARARTLAFADRCTLQAGWTTEVAKLSRELGERFDVVFVDAGHDEASVAADLEAWGPLVRRGGLLMGHDYGHRRFRGVQVAVDRYLREHNMVLAEPPSHSVWCAKVC